MLRNTLLILCLALTACGGASSGTTDWDDIAHRVRPQFVQEGDESMAGYLQRGFAKEINIAYVVHKGRQYEFISNSDFSAWEMDLSEIHNQAVQNLAAASPNIDYQVGEAGADGTGRYVIIEQGDGYDAVRFLLPKVQTRLKTELGHDIVIGLPTRDILVVWPIDFPLYQEFSEQIKAEFAAETEYPLTDTLLRLSDGILMEAN